ncbi:MAG: citramalate synthase, partial [Rickettsiales bacterium]|nr:citramalate synthase [Rickettsiales bacterium]
ERCGNANLTSLIPILKLKLGYELSVSDEAIKNLTKTSHFLDDLLNKPRNNFAPFVGKFAFAHKGGLHVSAVAKNPESYEHIKPELVGNCRLIMVSNQAGRSNIVNRLKELNIQFPQNTKTSQIADLVDKVKELEAKGYAYDSADASFELLVKRTLGIVPKFFELLGFRALDERRFNANGKLTLVSEATVKVKIDDEIILKVAEGNGPVNAIDNALKKCLIKKYPTLKDVYLTDYKVRILTPMDGTKAITRVQIELSDGQTKWSTIGVSQNIVDASFEALNDGIIYKLINN